MVHHKQNNRNEKAKNFACSSPEEEKHEVEKDDQDSKICAKCGCYLVEPFPRIPPLHEESLQEFGHGDDRRDPDRDYPNEYLGDYSPELDMCYCPDISSCLVREWSGRD